LASAPQAPDPVQLQLNLPQRSISMVDTITVVRAMVAAHLLAWLVQADGPHEDLCPAEYRDLTVHRVDSHGWRLSESVGAVVLMPQANTGPFFGNLSDYHDGPSMTAEAIAGSPHVPTARRTVLDGVPLTCIFNLFNVTNDTAEPIPYASVYSWHADAIGHYSTLT